MSRTGKKWALLAGALAAAVLVIAVVFWYTGQSGKSDLPWPEKKEAQEFDLQPDVRMTLSVEGDTLSFTITNQGQKNLIHGNGATASFQMFSNGRWYVIPMRRNHGATAEDYTLEPGQSYTSPFYQESYARELPDGDYRLVFDYSVYVPEENALQDAGCSAAEFSVEDGGFVIK